MNASSNKTAWLKGATPGWLSPPLSAPHLSESPHLVTVVCLIRFACQQIFRYVRVDLWARSWFCGTSAAPLRRLFRLCMVLLFTQKPCQLFVVSWLERKTLKKNPLPGVAKEHHSPSLSRKWERTRPPARWINNRPSCWMPRYQSAVVDINCIHKLAVSCSGSRTRSE